MSRWVRGIAVLALLLGGTACEMVDRVRGRGLAADTAAITASAGAFTVGLQTPGELRPGEEGVILLSLANRGGEIPRGTRLELLVPAWMEPAPPRPGDRAVTVSASAEEGTRLSYAMDEAPPARGELQTVEQRIRVTDRALAGGSSPWSRVVRARLISAEGVALAQVESEISVAGPPPGGEPIPRPGQTAAPRDRVGPVALGMTAAGVRAAAPGAQDTSWSAEGMQERGLVVPLGGGGRAVALLSGDTVARVVVSDSLPRTPEGLGVGSTLQELRSAYGRECVGVGEGDVVVWFPSAPGVSFALDAPASAAAPAPPASARVQRWWLRRGDIQCR